MSQGERQYEAVLFGATGYTGKYTAEHITTHLPTDFRWAVAGRSETKLKSLVDELHALNPDRPPPAIEIAQLNKNDLTRLAQSTKVLITTVGPFHVYGSPVVEACAEVGTHYLDVTGEVTWVHEMIEKHHDTAKRTGAIMISQNGVESAPPDLMFWKLVSEIREKLGVGVGEVIDSVYDAKAGVSGGTLATVMSLFENYSTSQIAKTTQPWSLCPINPPKTQRSKPLVEALTGVRTVSDLGTLTTSIQGASDLPIINRSWALYDNGQFYGMNFQASMYMRARNAFTGFGIHVALASFFTAMVFPPVRWIMKQLVYAPGEGATKEEAQNDYIEWRAIANSDGPSSGGIKRVFGRMRWEGSMYHLSGVCLGEAALILARNQTYAHQLGGGMLTPATLGQKYLDQLQKAGLKAEFEMMD